ncbi:WecB/TagA/CpsF family glycosyltransferase [Bacteroidota bacterium]
MDHLMHLQKDEEFYYAYKQADYITLDSQIIRFILKLLGTPVKELITGSDFFPLFCNYHKDSPDIRIFLLGAKPGVAEQAKTNINQRCGRKIIVGTFSPSFGFENNPTENKEILRSINQTNANVLAVGLGAPKQEKWIYRYRNRLKNIKIFLAIGATIDFEAGNVRRAPKWINSIGLEWFFRFLNEPRRLWKRYFIEDISFFWLVLKQKLNIYKDPFSNE